MTKQAVGCRSDAQKREKQSVDSRSVRTTKSTKEDEREKRKKENERRTTKRDRCLATLGSFHLRFQASTLRIAAFWGITAFSVCWPQGATVSEGVEGSKGVQGPGRVCMEFKRYYLLLYTHPHTRLYTTYCMRFFLVSLWTIVL